MLRFRADAPLPEVLRRCTESYSLQAVFARDVVAIHRDGLLRLDGLDAPESLTACVLPWPGALWTRTRPP